MEILNIHEIAEKLKVSRVQIDKLLKEGLPSILLSVSDAEREKRGFIFEDVLEWLKNREQNRG